MTQRPGPLPWCDVDLCSDIRSFTRIAGWPSRLDPPSTLIVPFTYSVDHKRQQVHAIGSGTLTINDFATYIAARVKDGVYDYDQLLELSGGDFDVSPRELIDAVKRARVHLREKPIPYTAIVATPGNATYGLARQLATLFDFEGATVQIFHTVDAGNAWLSRMRTERQQGHAPTRENR